MERKVIRLEKSSFGKSFAIDWPEGTSVVIIGTCTGSAGIIPRSLRLPHQIYAHDLKKMVADYNAREVVLIPASSNEYVKISKQAVLDVKT